MTRKQVIHLKHYWNQLLALILLLFISPLCAEPTENNACLRCHGMTTLAYRTAETGKIVDLSIKQLAFTHSAHGTLSCTKCHEGTFDHYPHHPDPQKKLLSCVGCHEQQDDATKRQYRFTTIDAEFKRSIHATSDAIEAANFNCHTCHNPHQFRASQIGETLTTIIQNVNALCLKCHETAPLQHAWLPNQKRHWETVRCLECHTPLTEDNQPVSHHILTAESSNHDCVQCHSKNSQLLQRLYQYRVKTDITQQGWFNAAVFNEAYVVGMSRSPLLDRVALGIIGLTLLVLIAHGSGRYRAQRRMKRTQQ
jgi:predicted CXXCH cytochrome family protein